MRNYEVTFIIDPVLSGDEIKGTAKTYLDQLKEFGSEIVHVDEMGLKQLAYPINKRSSGIYYCVEFANETGDFLIQLELAMRRDERILRFLTIKLDKYGVKYNADKRAGIIGAWRKAAAAAAAVEAKAMEVAKEKVTADRKAARKAEAAAEEAAEVAEDFVETPSSEDKTEA